MVKIVTFDPGHGGADGGAMNGKWREADIVLSMALKARDILLKEYSGVKVVMTRTTNKYLTLSQRSSIANRNKSDLFISFHLNAASSTAHGYESFTSTGASTHSYNLTGHVHRACMNVLPKGTRDRGRKKKNFAVVRYTNAPAILTENLFISNPKELDYLVNKGGIDRLARAHAEGVASALKLKKKSGTAKPSIEVPNVSIPGGDKMYKPSAKALTNSTAVILRRLEEKGLDPIWRKKLLDGTLTVDDAIGLIYVAFERSYFQDFK